MAIERHHYVPQGFLRGFCTENADSGKFIWVYEKIEGRAPRRVSVKSVAWKSFFYAQETETGETDTETLEKKFAESVDNVAPRIIRSIVATPDNKMQISEEDRGALAFFIGISLTRVPSFRDGMRDFFTKVAQTALNHLGRKDAYVAEGIKKYGVKAEAKEWVSLEPMIQIADQVAQSILAKNWQFFVPPPEVPLITSDNPVFFSISKEFDHLMAGPAHPLAEVVVNLRKDLALVCTPRGQKGLSSVYKMSSQDAKKFNRGVAMAACRFVFADHLSESLDRLVKKNIGKEQKIVI
jgi:hypothetical protein